MRAYKPQNTPFPKEGCSIESQARRQDQPQSQINLIHCPYLKLPQVHDVNALRLPFPQKFSISLP